VSSNARFFDIFSATERGLVFPGPRKPPSHMRRALSHATTLVDIAIKVWQRAHAAINVNCAGNITREIGETQAYETGFGT
jgi:hypothetical protein